MLTNAQLALKAISEAEKMCTELKRCFEVEFRMETIRKALSHAQSANAAVQSLERRLAGVPEPEVGP